ncbi:MULTISPECIES: acyl-CoA dehydrogenase family protein [unclassified Streptomyces]|uniref:acyl-CoA dehydrogenase family protein n=1 Tax=unclassified Streptomyces TaxID=2593676 RepID=UPI0028C419C2|nr:MULTISPECIES: acyl-CoA dehydrogenase [unclassified Streptomyces]WNO73952.1 acyl-CoA dehydrogenase [Streptomyces sp. AM8-1-1]
MDFRLTSEQRALRAGVREVLSRLLPEDPVPGGPGPGDPVPAPRLDRALWRELGRAGFFSLRLDEKEGGAGGGLPEAVLVFEEAGRVLLPGPLVATHLAAGSVEGAAAGETVVTRVDGVLVPWLDAADQVLGDATGAVPLRSVDPLTPLHRVPRPASAAEGTHDGVAALLTAAEQLGSAACATDRAVRHATQREQFGRPVGGFQAVKHLCAQMLVRTELARSAVYAAAVTGDRTEIAGAKLLADDAAVRNARDCVQVHGGMGFTWEAGVHLHLKRAWVRAQLWPTAGEAADIQAEALAALP